MPFLEEISSSWEFLSKFLSILCGGICFMPSFCKWIIKICLNLILLIFWPSVLKLLQVQLNVDQIFTASSVASPKEDLYKMAWMSDTNDAEHYFYLTSISLILTQVFFSSSLWILVLICFGLLTAGKRISATLSQCTSNCSSLSDQKFSVQSQTGNHNSVYMKYRWH